MFNSPFTKKEFHPSIRELQEEVHVAARKKGCWPQRLVITFGQHEQVTDLKLSMIMEDVMKSLDHHHVTGEIKREGNLKEQLMLTVSELGIAVEALRHGDSKAFGEKLADLNISIMNIAEGAGVDLENTILKMMVINKNRK